MRRRDERSVRFSNVLKYAGILHTMQKYSASASSSSASNSAFNAKIVIAKNVFHSRDYLYTWLLLFIITNSLNFCRRKFVLIFGNCVKIPDNLLLLAKKKSCLTNSVKYTCGWFHVSSKAKCFKFLFCTAVDVSQQTTTLIYLFCTTICLTWNNRKCQIIGVV